MTRRILINLTVFAAIGVTMVVWAFRTVVTFDFLDRPYRVSAEFSSSPGLHPGFEVDYLGLKVGKVDSVELRPGKVLVRLDIDRGVAIPEGVSAAVARKSAVGEPAVELTPAPGRGGAPRLRPGAVIPLSRTSVPPAYGNLFGAINRAVRAIDPADAKILTHELAVGFEGRADSLRGLIAGTDEFTATFAANTQMLDGLIDDLAALTHVLADHRAELGAGVDNLALLLRALGDVRGELADLRDEGPGILDRVNRLLAKGGPDIDCALDALGSFVPALATRDHLAELRQVLAQAPALLRVLAAIIGEDGGYKVLNTSFVLTARTRAALEHKYPLPQPAVAPIPNCPDGRRPGVAEQAKFPGADPGSVAPTAAAQAGPATPAAARGPADPGGPPGWLVYAPPALALVVLIRVIAGAVPVVRRRIRAKH
ncbi:MAG TPA: MCE family protein [Streptosporangiaceae bacterium]|nr:MCE family protein [Streptosporangiaceae bacterium]